MTNSVVLEVIGGVNNPCNFHKWAEINDKVSITYYDVNELDSIESEEKKSFYENFFVENQNKNLNNLLIGLIWWIGVIAILSVAGVGIIGIVILAKKKKKK